jgi:hypothetical protein
MSQGDFVTNFTSPLSPNSLPQSGERANRGGFWHQYERAFNGQVKVMSVFDGLQ